MFNINLSLIMKCVCQFIFRKSFLGHFVYLKAEKCLKTYLLLVKMNIWFVTINYE